LRRINTEDVVHQQREIKGITCNLTYVSLKLITIIYIYIYINTSIFIVNK
jgi:hypothetical protein